MRRLAALAVIALAACATSTSPSVDATLAAIEAANVRACPPGRVQAGAQTQGFGATTGVRVGDIALVRSVSDPTRAVRLRRIIVAPGGVIAWHDHTQVQGMALLVAGEMTELRNTCLDPLIYRAGDVAIEDADTAHSWRNDGAVDAVVLVSHIVPR
jgi:quercetin dioxygenase-like cupin family protein